MALGSRPALNPLLTYVELTTVQVVRAFQSELTSVRVEIEQLAVPPPVNGDLQLLACLIFREAPAQEVEEEPFTEVAVFGRSQCLVDGPHQGRPFPGLLGENLLGRQNVSSDETPAFGGDL